MMNRTTSPAVRDALQTVRSHADRRHVVLSSVEDFKSFYTELCKDQAAVMQGVAGLFTGERAVFWFDYDPDRAVVVVDRARGELLPNDFEFLLALRPAGRVERSKSIWRFVWADLATRAGFVLVVAAGVLSALIVAGTETNRVTILAALIPALALVASINALLSSSLTTFVPGWDAAVIGNRTFYRYADEDSQILLIVSAGLLVAVLGIAIEAAADELPAWSRDVAVWCSLVTALWVLLWSVAIVLPYYSRRNVALVTTLRENDYRRGVTTDPQSSPAEAD